MKNKNGAVAVFLAIIFASLMMAVAALLNAGAYITSKSMAEAAADLAGRSILAGYDKKLRQDYGLFAFGGEPASIERSLVDDIRYAFGQQNSPEEQKILDILMLDTVSADVSLASYSLCDIAVFEEQLIEQVKYRLLADPERTDVTLAKEVADAALLVQLTERMAAIMKEFAAFGTCIRTIADAQEAMIASEQELKVMLDTGRQEGTGGPVVSPVAARISFMLLDIRKSNSAILYNLDQIRNNLVSLRKSIEVVQSLCGSVQSEPGGKAAGAISGALQKAVAMLDRIDSVYTDDWRQAYMENAALLREFEKSPALTAASMECFVSRYHWDLDLAPLDMVDLEKLIGSLEIIGDGKNASDPHAAVGGNDEIEKTEGQRVLHNRIVRDSLPSSLLGDDRKSALLDLPEPGDLGDFLEIFRNGKDVVLSDLYISYYMKNHSMPHDETRNFFRNEAEYVLYGNPEDAENYQELKRDFLALRTALNIIHVYGDPEKKGQAAALAAGLVPGPYAGLGEFAVILAWSAAEAGNDLGLIERDHGVPLIKQKRDWALSIEALLDEGIGQTIIPESDDKMWGYKSYLLVFLLFADHHEKLLRTMDIIQINMQGRYDKEFRIAERYCGFSYDILLERKPLLPAFSNFPKTIIELEGLHVY